jgi:hypothetical protein
MLSIAEMLSIADELARLWRGLPPALTALP